MTHAVGNPAMMDFLRCLITCHTVVREKTGAYRAESPDELACSLRERSTKEMNVILCDQPKSYEVLVVNAFNSDRKRMSILIRDTSTGEYMVMCKGADNIMLPLCSVDKDPVLMADVNKTLIVSQKILSEADARRWY
eukprot:gene34672-44837_t